MENIENTPNIKEEISSIKTLYEAKEKGFIDPEIFNKMINSIITINELTKKRFEAKTFQYNDIAEQRVLQSLANFSEIPYKKEYKGQEGVALEKEVAIAKIKKLFSKETKKNHMVYTDGLKTMQMFISSLLQSSLEHHIQKNVKASDKKDIFLASETGRKHIHNLEKYQLELDTIKNDFFSDFPTVNGKELSNKEKSEIIDIRFNRFKELANIIYNTPNNIKKDIHLIDDKENSILSTRYRLLKAELEDFLSETKNIFVTSVLDRKIIRGQTNLKYTPVFNGRYLNIYAAKKFSDNFSFTFTNKKFVKGEEHPTKYRDAFTYNNQEISSYLKILDIKNILSKTKSISKIQKTVSILKNESHNFSNPKFSKIKTDLIEEHIKYIEEHPKSIRRNYIAYKIFEALYIPATLRLQQTKMKNLISYKYNKLLNKDITNIPKLFKRYKAIKRYKKRFESEILPDNLDIQVLEQKLLSKYDKIKKVAPQKAIYIANESENIGFDLFTETQQ